MNSIKPNSNVRRFYPRNDVVCCICFAGKLYAPKGGTAFDLTQQATVIPLKSDGGKARASVSQRIKGKFTVEIWRSVKLDRKPRNA